MRNEFADSYGQQAASPYRDTPNTSRPPAQPGQPQVPQQPATSGAGPSNYPVDPGFASWRTGGYNAPKYTTPGFAQSAMAGWDQSKWQDPNHQSPKYAVGRILSQYAPNDPAQRAQAIAQIQQAYPGSTFDGKDWLNIPGVGGGDILKGANNGGEAWQWGFGNGAPTTANGRINPLTAAIQNHPQQESANEALLRQLLYGQ